LSLPGSQPIPIEIRAHAPLGAQAYEFSIPGFTAEAGILVTDLVSNPEADYAEGNPFAEGARIVFPTCESTPVMLYTATLFVLGSHAYLHWTVAPHSSAGPGTTCPTVVTCGGGGVSCVLAGGPRQVTIPPYNPSPADGATDVPLDAKLDYSLQFGSCTCMGVGCFALYFGVDPDPPLFFNDLCGSEDVPFPNLELKPSTTYYWRAAASFCDAVYGPVWSFMTAPPIAVEAFTWSNVKKRFR